jgi:hypothetical protein
MNGAQDLGGMMGFGRIGYEPDEPWFHADWERRAFGITLAMGATGSWGIDTSRAARESLHPADYLSSSYYEIWAKGLEKLLLRQGLVTDDELKAGKALGAPKPVARVLKAENAPAALAKGSPSERPAEQPARYDPRHAPDRPHAAAALRPRQARFRRTGPWRPCLPGFGCGRAGREPAMALYRALLGAGIVGRGGRPVARRLDRRLGELS